MSLEAQQNVDLGWRWHVLNSEDRDFDRTGEFWTPELVRHGPNGTVQLTVHAFAEQLKQSRLASYKTVWDDVVARADKVALRWTHVDTDPKTGELLFNTGIQLWRFKDGKLTELWVALRYRGAGPWPGEPFPREQWSIASGGEMTPEEQRNMVVMESYLESCRTHGAEGLRDLFFDPLIVHGPGPTRTVSIDQFVLRVASKPEEYPGLELEWHDRFVVGDRAVIRWNSLWPNSTPENPSPMSGLTVYRLENGRIAELWQAMLPNGIGWD